MNLPPDKVMELLGGGSVINGAYPVQFQSNHLKANSNSISHL